MSMNVALPPGSVVVRGVTVVPFAIARDFNGAIVTRGDLEKKYGVSFRGELVDDINSSIEDLMNEKRRSFMKSEDVMGSEEIMEDDDIKDTEVTLIAQTFHEGEKTEVIMGGYSQSVINIEVNRLADNHYYNMIVKMMKDSHPRAQVRLKGGIFVDSEMTEPFLDGLLRTIHNDHIDYGMIRSVHYNMEDGYIHVIHDMDIRSNTTMLGILILVMLMVIWRLNWIRNGRRRRGSIPELPLFIKGGMDEKDPRLKVWGDDPNVIDWRNDGRVGMVESD